MSIAEFPGAVPDKSAPVLVLVERVVHFAACHISGDHCGTRITFDSGQTVEVGAAPDEVATVLCKELRALRWERGRIDAGASAR